ncbi:MAG: flagellar basal body P-ring protein FlgI [Phycisphaerales bacterium]|nr:flagellar basal body P-ring protein FlgI [Phycisphaerales bacterium]
MRRVAVVLGMVLGLAMARPALGVTVKELSRLKGQGESVIQGIGLVVGLSATGDSGKELAMARPLMQVLANNGNMLGSPKELASSKSVALVTVTCTIPAAGARADDRLDAMVAVVNSAVSLKGGRLFLAPLRGPRRDDPVIWAMAEGAVDLEDTTVPTVGRVRGGARILEDVMMPALEDVFELIIHPHFSGYPAATEIAASINHQYFNSPQAGGPSIAMVVDDRTIRVMVPEAERGARAAFVADVLNTDINVALLKLPAQVVCNQRTGAIIVTGDVQISPVAITHKDLVITTTIPPPQPTQEDPLIERNRWTGVYTSAKPSETARLTDLLAAFKKLDVPVAEQISILQMLRKAGKLQAELIVD